MRFKNFALLATTVLFFSSFVPPLILAMEPQDDKPFAGGKCSPSAAATILPDIPQIPWSELTRGELIGVGGFGKVYKGKWRGQDVALKMLTMDTLSSAAIRRDFDKEVSMMWNSQYPRILRLHGICTEPGHCAMVMELMHRSLYDSIHEGQEISELTQLQIAIDIAEGLKSLHEQNPPLLHRDLKSHNILLSKRDRAKVSDFGLAKIRLHTTSASVQANLKDPGAPEGHTGGTARWKAPETFGGKPRWSIKSDMYGYGMILWEILTRQIPFKDQPDEKEIRHDVETGVREDIPENCPPVWREIISGCWHQDPNARPTARQVLDLLTPLKPPSRPLWLPEEDLSHLPMRAEGYILQPASEGDWDLVLKCYAPHPVPGYDIGQITVVFNPSKNQKFEACQKLLQERQGNPLHSPLWRQASDNLARADVSGRLDSIAAPYQDDAYEDVKLMPLWHGTRRDRLSTLLRGEYAALATTDHGYFGNGVYATHEAVYAQEYASKFGSNGVLIFNWGITYNSRPILRSDYDPINQKLTCDVDRIRYDTHFIPIGADYAPITPPENHRYTEVMFFDSGQILPRYLITLQRTLLPNPLPVSQTSVVLNALRERHQREQMEARRMIERSERARQTAEARVQGAVEEATRRAQEEAAQKSAAELAEAQRRFRVEEQARQAIEVKQRQAEEVARQSEAALSEAKRRADVAERARQEAEQTFQLLSQEAEAGRQSSAQLAQAKQALQTAEETLRRETESGRRSATDLEDAKRRLEASERTHQAEQQQMTAQLKAMEEALRRAEAAAQPRPVTPTSPPPVPVKPPPLPAPGPAAAAAGGPLVLAQPEIPLVARGHEAVYRRFLNGKLIYRPDPKSDAGKIELPISNLKDAQGRPNPLEGTFDLSVCRDPDVEKHLSISTGYRKAKNPANADKWEIWLAPRFLVAANVQGSTRHYNGIMGNWNGDAAPVALFYNWGNWNDLGDYWYLTKDSMADLGNNNLYEKRRSTTPRPSAARPPYYHLRNPLQKISSCF